MCCMRPIRVSLFIFEVCETGSHSVRELASAGDTRLESFGVGLS